jgi:hypothetical protein
MHHDREWNSNDSNNDPVSLPNQDHHTTIHMDLLNPFNKDEAEMATSVAALQPAGAGTGRDYSSTTGKAAALQHQRIRTTGYDGNGGNGAVTEEMAKAAETDGSITASPKARSKR